MLNPFSTGAFDMASMTQGINLLPNMYGRLNALDLMPFRGITTTQLLVELKDGQLHIVRSRPRGAPGDSVTVDKRNVRSFVIPHLPLDDVLLPDDYQNVRAFGAESEMETLAGIVTEKQQKMKNALDQTIEYLRMGALKGIILDADGSVLYNLFNEFGITAAAAAGDVGKYLTVDFALDDEDTDVRGKCLSVVRHVEKNLRGEQMRGVRALVNGDFFDALTSHPKVEKAFAAYQALNQDLASDYRGGFRFGNVIWEEYAASWTDKDGNVRAAIASGEGHAYPEGTGNTFETACAPADFNETANTVGLPYYSRQEPREMGRGTKVHAQSNPLPICKRPAVLVKVTS